MNISNSLKEKDSLKEEKVKEEKANLQKKGLLKYCCPEIGRMLEA